MSRWALALLLAFAFGVTAARAGHPGPAITLSIHNSQTVAGWDNNFAFFAINDGEDPPFGRTLDIANAGTGSPALRFTADTTPTNTAYSFTITTPLMYWNHLDSNPSWGPTQNGEFIQIHDADDANALITIITDDPSTGTPVADDYVGGVKSAPLSAPEDHLNSYFLFTPNGSGTPSPSGALGAYGFGMTVHLWQNDSNGNPTIDYGSSDPFFVAFRVRPIGTLPSNGMTAQQFSLAVEAGQATIPEPATAASLLSGCLWLSTKRRRRSRLSEYENPMRPGPIRVVSI